MTAPTTSVHDAPFTGRGAWRGGDFASPEAWTYRLPPAALAELDRAMRRVQDAGKDLSTLTRTDFPAPSFAADGAALRRELESGRGFVLIRGLPIDNYNDREASLIYWGIATYLGAPIPQNVKDEYLFSVRDEGYDFHRDYGATGVRISRTASAIDFHTDSSAAYAGYTPDIVALLALRTAKAGGETAIVSAQTVHNILREERPECLRRLYAPYYFDRRAELRPGESSTILAPVFACHDSLSIRYFRFNLMRGHETACARLSPADTDPLDALESACRRDGLAVRFQMQRGDMQFVNNRFVLHSRTAFEDPTEPGLRRHFLRLWMRYKQSNRR
ncbi:MAG: TauD/TfdA family dioxygenase [Acidobacteria bacterium]|nr:TauD/TfdA family dioxygenase [Acidobacteriota bacterium]